MIVYSVCELRQNRLGNDIEMPAYSTLSSDHTRTGKIVLNGVM